MPHARRRPVAIESIAALRQEIERLDAARRQGRLEHTGDWSLDQCCQHLGRWIAFSIDGFPFRYPWHFRLAGRILRCISWSWLVALALRPGFRNPQSVRAVEPDAVIADGDGIAYLRRQMDRIENGERMTRPSPVEGPLTHEQWRYFHLRHAALHLSFHHPIATPSLKLPNP